MKIISIHISGGGYVVDVAGIPEDTKLVVTDVDTLEENVFTKKDNCQ